MGCADAGRLPRAAVLALEAQQAARAGSSAFIQATAQEARAWARLGAKPQAYDALTPTEALASRLPARDQPEHRYRYDPAKAEAYVAITLSWLGDPAAETYARQVLAGMEGGNGEPPLLGRAASARLNLGLLALAAADKLDEAAATALDAVNSGLLVPSNYWRAAEVISAVDGRGVPEARTGRGIPEAVPAIVIGRDPAGLPGRPGRRAAAMPRAGLTACVATTDRTRQALPMAPRNLPENATIRRRRATRRGCRVSVVRRPGEGRTCVLS
jgi:hypothetical protein